MNIMGIHQYLHSSSQMLIDSLVSRYTVLNDRIVNDELGKKWNEMVMTYFKILSQRQLQTRVSGQPNS